MKDLDARQMLADGRAAQVQGTIDTARKRIDTLDTIINNALRLRAEEVRTIGALKKATGQATCDTKREAEVLARYDAGYCRDVALHIIAESRDLQRK